MVFCSAVAFDRTPKLALLDRTDVDGKADDLNKSRADVTDSDCISVLFGLGEAEVATTFLKYLNRLAVADLACCSF